MKFCPHCGKENAEDRSFCLYCKKSLRLYRSEANAPVAAPREPESARVNVPIEPHKSDSKLIRNNPGTIRPEPMPVLRTPEPVRSAPAPAWSEPAPVLRTPEPVRSAPAPVRPEPTPVRPAPAPVWHEPAPVRPAAPVKRPAPRISAGQELKLLIREGFMVLTGEPRNLLISLLFPVAAAIVTVWIAGENMFVDFESTKSACLIMVCAAIWGGLFNSIQVVVKERDNVRRDYVSGALRIECFMASRALIQLLLCAAQSAVLCLGFLGVRVVHGNELPSDGIIGGSPMIEYYITLFLVMYATDSLGLMISSIVKTEQLASQLSPYILIVQLLFSGALFEMEGAATLVSGLMTSKWGMKALGSISELNKFESKLSVRVGFPIYLESKDYEPTGGNLLGAWMMLLLFVAVTLVVGTVCLRQVKNDKRS